MIAMVLTAFLASWTPSGGNNHEYGSLFLMSDLSLRLSGFVSVWNNKRLVFPMVMTGFALSFSFISIGLATSTYTN